MYFVAEEDMSSTKRPKVSGDMMHLSIKIDSETASQTFEATSLSRKAVFSGIQTSFQCWR